MAARILVVGVLMGLALVIGLTDAVYRLPQWLVGALVAAIGVSGLGLVSRQAWSKEAKDLGPGCLGLLLSPLPISIWRVIMGILSLGIVCLGLGALVDAIS